MCARGWQTCVLEAHCLRCLLSSAVCCLLLSKGCCALGGEKVIDLLLSCSGQWVSGWGCLVGCGNEPVVQKPCKMSCPKMVDSRVIDVPDPPNGLEG